MCHCFENLRMEHQVSIHCKRNKSSDCAASKWRLEVAEIEMTRELWLWTEVFWEICDTNCTLHKNIFALSSASTLGFSLKYYSVFVYLHLHVMWYFKEECLRLLTRKEQFQTKHHWKPWNANLLRSDFCGPWSLKAFSWSILNTGLYKSFLADFCAFASIGYLNQLLNGFPAACDDTSSEKSLE